MDAKDLSNWTFSLQNGQNFDNTCIKLQKLGNINITPIPRIFVKSNQNEQKIEIEWNFNHGFQSQSKSKNGIKNNKESTFLLFDEKIIQII